MTSRRAAARLAAALLLLWATTAPAQTDDNVQVFPAEYFARSHPADAFDMVRKLPGFELIEGDEEVRGFTGSRGNVLFDGRAPTSKQETLEQMLRRIPASTVLRIELIRGGAKSTATGGYDLVANVIRRKLASTSASVLAGASGADEIGIKPDFRAELTRQSGKHRLDASAALETDIDDDSGQGSIVEETLLGNEIGREDRDEREVERTASVNVGYKFPVGAGEVTSNANLARERTIERILSLEDEDSSLATDKERLWSAEGSAQFNNSLGDGDLEALAIQRFGWLDARAEEGDESFTEETQTSETIGRAEYRWGSERLRLFGSIEGTLNTLKSDVALVLGGVNVPITGSDVHVSERRAEGAFGAIWKPAETVVVEPTMRVETSTIKSTGDSPSSEHFLFWKPRLRLSWDQGSRRIQTTVEREAAQLDFGDFVASAELDRDDVTAGATALKPPTTWSFSTTFEQRFWDSGAILLTFRREWIDDVLDEVLVVRDGELFDAVGNIGDADRRILKAELTLPFERLGIAGMQLKSSLTFVKSRVTDPITGFRRPIGEDRPFEGDVRLTHDLPGGRWSWGVDASLAHRERDFGSDDDELEKKGTSFGGYVEFRPRADWRVRLEAENIGSRSLTETRRNFEDTRASGIIDSIETRRLRTSPIVMFSVRKSFGAAAD